MLLETLKAGQIYECKVGRRLVPVYLTNVTEEGVSGNNLHTNKAILIKKNQLSRIRSEITNISEWREKVGCATWCWSVKV